MTKQHVRVGVIGAGTFAEECHIPGVQAHVQGEVVALCARNREHAMDVATRFGVPDVYTDYRDLLARPDIDAVTVATPDALHFPIVIAALEAGKHVFCEKPLAMNTDEAQQMTEMAGRSGRVAMVSFTFRYSRSLQALRQLIRQRAIGTPFYVAMQLHWGEIGYPGASLGWYDRAALSAAGTWADGASHLFDALAYILAPIQQVCAQMMIVPRESGIAQPDTVDVATCLGRLRLPGEQVPHELDAVAYADREPGIVHVTLLTSRVDRGPDEIEVVGTQGAARIALTRGQNERLSLLHEDNQWRDVPLPDDARTNEPRALKRMMGAFVDAVLHDHLGPDDPSFAAGLHTQRAIDAAIQSARDQHWMKV